MVDRDGTTEALSPDPPSSWLALRDAFARLASLSEQEKNLSRTRLEQVTERIAQLQQLARQRTTISPGKTRLPKALDAELRDAIRKLETAQSQVCDDIAGSLEDFEHAMENEERFVVLVFGEVNAGKSALANHVAGLDGGPWRKAAAGECFVGQDRSVARLEESPVECTRAYQGFRLPGLLWIDCPGVLSANPANAEMARRLVARADFILFTTSSDAPFKRSEMMELKRLIDLCGARGLRCFLAITRADRVQEDVDDTGAIIRSVSNKASVDVNRQVSWAHEALKGSGLLDVVRLERPFALSTYVARDALGCQWSTGKRVHPVPSDWTSRYTSSGMPQLLSALVRVVEREGQELRLLWPEKRARVLKQSTLARLEPSEERLATLTRLVSKEREALLGSSDPIGERAAAAASAAVAECLSHFGIHRPGKFKKKPAETRLREVLVDTVQEHISTGLGEILDGAGARIGEAIGNIVHEVAFELSVREKYRTSKYRSSTKGRGIGKAIGGAGGSVGGAWAGGAIGSAFGPPGMIIGGLIGGILGGIFGGLGGESVGGMVEEEVVVTVPAGMNAEEVIAKTQEEMSQAARHAVAATVQEIDASLFSPLAEAVRGLQVDVMQLKAACTAPQAHAKVRARPAAGGK